MQPMLFILMKSCKMIRQLKAKGNICLNLKNLFVPTKTGSHKLKNKIVMAPLTRCRADDSNPQKLTSYVVSELSQLKVAYLHMMRADFFGIQKGDVMTEAREAFRGTIIGNMGYTPEEAADSIEKGLIDAIAFGHHYVSNPNLVEKIKNGLALVEPDQNTFYTHDAKGYTDYSLS